MISGKNLATEQIKYKNQNLHLCWSTKLTRVLYVLGRLIFNEDSIELNMLLKTNLVLQSLAAFMITPF